MSIALKTFQAALWKTGSTWVQVGIDLLGVVVMARMLGPESYGVMGAALLVVGLMRLLFEGALVECLVQRPDLAPGHIDATFWSCMGLACFATLASFAFAPVLAQAAGVAAATPLVQAISLLMPISAASATPRMLQERALDFRGQSKANAITSLLSNVCGIGAALTGAGIWSLVLMESVRAIAPHGFIWANVSWRPGFSCRGHHFKELARFNVLVIGTYLVGHLDRLLPRALIAHLLGPVVLGYYLIAARLFDELTRLVIGPLAGICMPIVARLQADQPALQRTILGLYQAAILFAMPVYFGMIAIAPVALPWLFGTAWSPAVFGVQILMLSALRTSTAVFNVSVLRGVGRADLPIALLSFGLLLNLILIPALAPWGLPGVMLALVLRQFGSWPLGCLFIRRATGLPVSQQLQVGVKPALAALLMLILVAAFVDSFESGIAPALLLSIAVALGALIYSASLYGLDSELLRRVFAIARAAIRRDEHSLAISLGDPALASR